MTVEVKSGKKRGRPRKEPIKESDHQKKLVVVLKKADMSEIEKPINLLKKRSTRIALKDFNDPINQSTNSQTSNESKVKKKKTKKSKKEEDESYVAVT